MGPCQANFASVVGLSEVVASTPDVVFHIVAADPHPMSYERVELCLAACRTMFDDKKGPWDDFLETWRRLYPLSHANSESLELIEKSTPLLEKLSRAILETKMNAFSGRSLKDVIPASKYSPQKIKNLLNSDASDFSSSTNILEIDPISVLISFRVIQMFGGRSQSWIRKKMSEWLKAIGGRE